MGLLQKEKKLQQVIHKHLSQDYFKPAIDKRIICRVVFLNEETLENPASTPYGSRLLGFFIGDFMEKQKNKKDENEIDAAVEQWVKLVIAHIEATKRQKIDGISEKN